jgi:hypothetical protein
MLEVAPAVRFGQRELSKSMRLERLMSRTKRANWRTPVIPWVKATTVKAAQRPVPEKFDGWRERIVRFLRVLGPYAAIELLLPGGSLIALLFWLYQSQRKRAWPSQSAQQKNRATSMSVVGDHA